MIELGLNESYFIAARRSFEASRNGEIDEISPKQMVAVVRIRKAAVDILSELEVEDIVPLSEGELLNLGVLKTGDVLSNIRNRLRMKKFEFARLMGVNPSTVGKYLKNTIKVNEESLNRLMDNLGDQLSDEEKQLLLNSYQAQHTS